MTDIIEESVLFFLTAFWMCWNVATRCPLSFHLAKLFRRVVNPQLSQPHMGDLPSLGSFQFLLWKCSSRFMSPLVLSTSHQDALFQVNYHQPAVEGQDYLPWPGYHTFFEAAWDIGGFFGCKGTLLKHVQLTIHQYPFCQDCTLSIHFPASIDCGVAVTLLQDLPLGSVEPHEFHLDLILDQDCLCQDHSAWHPIPHTCWL